MQLSAKTGLYWRVSSIYNGTLNEPLNSGDAIKITGDILQWLGPKRFLKDVTTRLHNTIIEGNRRRKNKDKTVAKILAFQAPKAKTQ
jgi:hypothetical protein